MTSLRSLKLGAVQSVGETLVIRGNNILSSLALSDLHTVRMYVAIEGNTALRPNDGMPAPPSRLPEGRAHHVP